MMSAVAGGMGVIVANGGLLMLGTWMPPGVMLIGELLRLLAAGALLALLLTTSGVVAAAALAGFIAAAVAQLFGGVLLVAGVRSASAERKQIRIG